MAFVTGAIVRPLYPLLRIGGQLFDWAGYRSAQGWVLNNIGATGASAVYFDPKTTTYNNTIANPGGTWYVVKIWDPATGALVQTNYPETQLIAATVLGVPITALFSDPATDARCLQLCKVRS